MVDMLWSRIEIATLVFKKLSAGNVMKSIMSTTGKGISKRSEDGTISIIQFSCKKRIFKYTMAVLPFK